MNEEMGLSGARAYAERARRRAAASTWRRVEVDSGAGRPSGFGVVGGRAVALLRSASRRRSRTVGAAAVVEAHEAGADLSPMGGKVPLFSIDQDLTTYFDWHHTAADTFDKIDPMDLALNTAAIAVAAYGLADADETLPVVAPAAASGPCGRAACCRRAEVAARRAEVV